LEISLVYVDISKIPNHSFFTIEQLDNQLRVFNLTKYAHPELHKLPSPSSSLSTLALPQLGRFSSISNPLPSYIPPYRQNSQKPLSPNPKFLAGLTPLKSSNKTTKILIKEVEEAWSECLKGGIFAIWNCPLRDFPVLSGWLEENYENQVSIFHYSNRIVYLQCEEESVKKEFISVSKCFFNGHYIKFIEWS